MNRESFERVHETAWKRLEAILDRLEGGGRKSPPPTDAPRDDELPALYREACHHLALVRQRRLGLDLEERLNRIALRGRQHLHRARGRSPAAAARFLLLEFPRLLRREWRIVLAAHLLFYVPFVAFLLLAWIDPPTVELFVPPEMLDDVAEAYGPGGREKRDEHGLSSQLMMFGFYINNNIGIAFRTFAGGILFGLGSVFFLVHNGVFIGAASGHVTAAGQADEFWSFVITHGSFELTAIVIAGAAGLRLGASVLSPGRRTRRESLRQGAGIAVRLVMGAAAMLVVAAFLEAFWSGNHLLPHALKYAGGTACWILVPAWLALAGRGDA